MKKLIAGSVHTLFRIHLFEWLLRVIVQGKFVDSFWAKLISPHYSYPRHTYKVVTYGQLMLHAATGKQMMVTDDFADCHFDVICYVKHQESIALDNNKAVRAA
jgi:hypothetical protein